MEFQRNHGTSLKDLVVGLQVAIDKAMARAEQVAFDANAAAEVLKVNVEATKLLAAQDRAQIARLLVIVDRLGVQAEDKESE
jgi:hypothetical protein